jgi:hypothetical protein
MQNIPNRKKGMEYRRVSKNERQFLGSSDQIVTK